MVPVIGNDHTEPFGQCRDDREEVHLPVKTPAVNQNKGRRVFCSGLSHEHLAFADEDRATGDMDRPHLLPVVGGLQIGAKQSPRHPAETEGTKYPPDHSHPDSVDQRFPTRTKCGERYAHPGDESLPS